MSLKLSLPAGIALAVGMASLMAPYTTDFFAAHHAVADVLHGLAQVIQALLPSLVARAVKE